MFAKLLKSEIILSRCHYHIIPKGSKTSLNVYCMCDEHSIVHSHTHTYITTHSIYLSILCEVFFLRRRCSPDGCVFVVGCHLTCRSCCAPFNVVMHIHIGRQFYLFMFALYDLSMWCRNKAFNEFDSHPFADLLLTQTAPFYHGLTAVQ